MIYGYDSVSTDGQSLAARAVQLREAGAEKIFRETASGARSGRLARSTRDLLDTLATSSTKGASSRSLGDAWADTNTAHGRLILTVLGGLAEFERELIVSRTTEGRTRAKAAGVKLGRKPTLRPHQKANARKRRVKGESPAAIARSYNVSRWTIQRLSA